MPVTGESSWHVLALLVREPESPYDPNAIAVWVGDAQIGHVNRDDAADLAPLLDQVEACDCRAACHCRIYGGTQGIYGADLWILANSRLGSWVRRQVASWNSPDPSQSER